MSDSAEPSDWRAPMADETEARARRAPAPPPRHPARPPEPRPRTVVAPEHQPPRLIRPSEHLAIVERSMERRPPPLVPSVTVLHGPRPSLPPPVPGHRPVAPPPLRMPAPVTQVMRPPQQRREIQKIMDEDYQPERRRGRAPGKKKNPISVKRSDEDFQPERKRGRPTGKNRVPLTMEERRARNAQYERERRDGTAEAMRHLAEAAGCLPSMPNKVILQTACHQLVQYGSATDEVTALKQTNDTIIAEIVHLKNFLAKGKKAKKDKKKKRSLDSNKSSNHGVKICNKNEKKKKNRKTKTKSPTTEMEPANSNITQEFVQQSSEVNTSVEVDDSPDSGIYEPDLFPLCDDWPLEPGSWALPLEDPFNGGLMELGQLFEEMESPYIEQGEVEVQNPV